TPDIPPHRGGAGEGNEGRHRVLDKGITDFRTGAHHHAQHALRQAGLTENMRQQQATGHRRITGRLDDHRIAQRQCRGYRAGAQVQREVPRADHADHAQRRAVYAALLAGHVGRKDTAVHSPGQAGGFQGNGPGGAPLDLRLDPGATGLTNEPVDDFILTLIEDLDGAAQDIAPRRRAHGGPVDLSLLGGAVGLVQVFAGCHGQAEELLPGIRVGDLQVAVSTTDTPLATDGLQLQVLKSRLVFHWVLSLCSNPQCGAAGRLRTRAAREGDSPYRYKFYATFSVGD